MRPDETNTPDAPPSRPHCPKCPSGRGDARVVHLTGQGRTVTYVCDQCLHEWDVADIPRSPFGTDPTVALVCTPSPLPLPVTFTSDWTLTLKK